jgi:hypothetical protein
MMSPVRPETVHAMERVRVIHPSDGKALTLVGVGKMRVPVRHLLSSKLECRPNELARGHFGRASKYSVAINSFVYFIS